MKFILNSAYTAELTFLELFRFHFFEKIGHFVFRSFELHCKGETNCQKYNE
jgi:hypothetical protein